MTRDMSQNKFVEACREHDFRRQPFGLGYYSLPPDHSRRVSIWNAGKNRRAQLAYLIREQERCERERAVIATD